MRLLGFSVQKPRYQAWQQDPVVVRTWGTETYPVIRAQARPQRARNYFPDESGMRSDYHTSTTWAPVGAIPVVAAAGRRFSLNMILAVSLQGRFRVMLNEGSVTASVFGEFLERLLVGMDKPMFLVVEGRPDNKSKAVRDFVERQNGRLTLFSLPPYSLHLKTDEVVWGHVKREVSRKLVQSKEELKKFALSTLHRIQNLPNPMKSFFQQHECQYAAAT